MWGGGFLGFVVGILVELEKSKVWGLDMIMDRNQDLGYTA